MSNTTTTKQTPVMGYLAENFQGLNEKTPAVIVNPEARPLDLMAWCWAELQSMQAAADVMVCRHDDIKKGDISALILNRLAPLSLVFEKAMNQLYSDAKQSGRV